MHKGIKFPLHICVLPKYISQNFTKCTICTHNSQKIKFWEKLIVSARAVKIVCVQCKLDPTSSLQVAKKEGWRGLRKGKRGKSKKTSKPRRGTPQSGRILFPSGRADESTVGDGIGRGSFRRAGIAKGFIVQRSYRFDLATEVLEKLSS